MAIPQIYEYRIYCTTEQTFVTFYGVDPPTTCPNDTNHTVNPDSVQKGHLVGPDTVIAKDSSPDAGYFQASTIVIDIPANAGGPQTIITDIKYPFDMYIWEMSIAQNPASVGDSLSVQLSPDTIIGLMTVDAKVGDIVINCSGTIFNYVVRGSEIGISDGKNTEYPGRVTAVDSKAGTITVETPLVNAYSSASPTYILFSVYPIRNLICDSAARITLGNKGLKAKVVPAGTTIRVIYVDNTIGDAVKAYLQIQYYHL